MVFCASRPLLVSTLCLLVAACSEGGGSGTPIDPQPDMATEVTGSGRCESDPIVHPETMLDTTTGATDLAFASVTGFAIPAQLGQTETREIFTSAAAFERYFGAPAPSSIDFGKSWVFFYSAGSKSTDGYVPAVARIRTVADQVRVDTSLEIPGAACAVATVVTRPSVLVAFARPTLSLCRSTYHHLETTKMCVPPEPGPACTGTLTDRGIDEMLTTRPRAMIPSESGFTAYNPNSVSIGNYQTGSWTRVCKSATECDPWAQDTLTGDYYTGSASFYREATAMRLILVSPIIGYQVNIGGGMNKSCFRYAKGMGDMMKQASGSTQVAVQLVESSGCYIGGATANGDSFRLGPVSGVFADRCFRLTQNKQTVIGVNSYRENLVVVSGSW